MNAAQKTLIAQTVAILKDLEAIGTPAAAEAARSLKESTFRQLGEFDPAELLAAIAAA